jgi:hypothetical protein
MKCNIFTGGGNIIISKTKFNFSGQNWLHANFYHFIYIFPIRTKNYFSSVAYVWVRGAKTTGLIAKKLFFS